MTPSLPAALAARDVCHAVIVLDRLALGTATNGELRRLSRWPGDSFRSLLRWMERQGLIERRPGRWALANSGPSQTRIVDRLAA